MDAEPQTGVLRDAFVWLGCINMVFERKINTDMDASPRVEGLYNECAAHTLYI